MSECVPNGSTNGRGVFRRLMNVIGVLARHRLLGVLVRRSKLPPARAVRAAIEELGLTYIKFGQVLAMQRSLLPETYADELEQLHDQLSPMPFTLVESIVECELGAPLAAVFSHFSEVPLGAASIAQVHEAQLADGRRVAVKVQRPNLRQTIDKDLAVLRFLVRVGERLLPRLRPLDLIAALHELHAALMRETDFAREASSIAIFRKTTEGQADVWIPEVVAECTRGAVLTMEFSDGERIDAYARKHPDEMPRVINTLVRVMMQTIFEEGVFHADPHPGNVFVLPDGRLSLLDFGSTGELDERLREGLSLLLEAVINGDARAATAAYLEMTPEVDEVNRASLQSDIKAALYEVRRPNVADMSIGHLFDALVRAGTRNGVRNPGEFVLLARSVVILEAMVRQLTPGHDYIKSFRSQLSRLTVRHLSSDRFKDKAGKFARDLARLAGDGPADLRRILRRMAEGDLGRLPRLEAVGERLGQHVERMALAIIYATLVVSGALLALEPHGGKHIVGAFMITSGIIGMIATIIGVYRRR